MAKKYYVITHDTVGIYVVKRNATLKEARALKTRILEKNPDKAEDSIQIVDEVGLAIAEHHAEEESA